MDQPDSWRTLLGTRIHKNPQERQRIASALGVNPMTLVRWASGMTIPRPQNLRQLLGALPSTESSVWRELIAQEFPEFAELETGPEGENESVEIPSEFYARVINTYTITLPQRRFWAISNLVLQQAMFLGIESLAGYTTTAGHMLTTNRSDRDLCYSRCLLLRFSGHACHLLDSMSQPSC